MINFNEPPLDTASFEWDNNKRLANIAKHGIDFEDAIDVFFEPHLDEPLSYPHEARRKALGLIGDRLVAVIYTWRGPSIRIISARRARANEQRAYRALHPRGDP
ncbi:BrnT family toxin [Pinisolibacter sp.]|uniref:BrnT family toxin n=1 Tax=Pinisolibacter sp. TaxID=2172024 RepID=UPI002FDCD4EF